METLPDSIPTAPATFAPITEAVNALLRAAKPWTNAQGKNGISVTVSEGNATVAIKDEVLKLKIEETTPPDFTYEEFTICDSGVPASRWIRTWASDPTPPS